MSDLVIKIKNKEITITSIHIDSNKVNFRVGYDYADDIKSIWLLNKDSRKHKSKSLKFKLELNKDKRKQFYYSKRFRDLLNSQQHWEMIRKKIEQQVYYNSHQKKDSIDRLNPFERFFLVRKLEIISRYFDFADNYRIGKIGNSPSMRAYRREKERGCCGFYDEKVSLFWKDYLIGFNYGH